MSSTLFFFATFAYVVSSVLGAVSAALHIRRQLREMRPVSSRA